jgi:FAD/FMN-containing dehydrogenase/Fe-S oxidoreductase
MARADAVDRAALEAALRSEIEGEVRFDALSRALYSTDASIYQIIPLGVVVPKSREDVVRTVRTCARLGCPITCRGGGTSQAGQTVGEGIQIDFSKHLNRLLEVNPGERWARVEPGIVLAELNAGLRPHGLQFAPDVSTANRATIGGMMANNSSGARSVLYGKTIDHVLAQEVVLADGSLARFGPLPPGEARRAAEGDSLEARARRELARIVAACGGEIDRRYPKILRRVGGYNLDAIVREPSDLVKLTVGSEGTLAVVVEAKLRLVPLPKAKALAVLHFEDLLDALGAVPAILELKPAAVEVVDRFVLDHTRGHPVLSKLRDFVQGDPGGILLVEFYADRPEEAASRVEALASRGLGYHCHRAFDAAGQARIWSLREAALGLSMAMKGDAKAFSFVEDTAVAPERLRAFIERFLALLDRHGTRAGVYAHASVGCLHVRPVVNLKTEEGVRQFEAIACAVADLVLEFGGALSGEHGDGLLRSPFMEKMFGPVLYQAFREVKRAFDPQGILNPGKIVDAPPLAANLRFGPGYRTPDPPSRFDYAEYGGLGRAVEMCSGVGACRKKRDGTMCPSYAATREETHSTRGRANVLRLALSGQMPDLGDAEVKEALDLCLECRACRVECPVGVDMARWKSEFLSGYWERHGMPFRAALLGDARTVAVWGSRLAPLSNWFRGLGRLLLGMDRRRALPSFRRRTFADRFPIREGEVLVFRDTFNDHYEPEIGLAAVDVLRAAGRSPALAPNVCCGRPAISMGLLGKARTLAAANAEALLPAAEAGRKIVFLEPSCLSAVREDAPDLVPEEYRQKARRVAEACVLFEEFLEGEIASGRAALPLKAGPPKVVLHGH